MQILGGARSAHTYLVLTLVFLAKSLALAALLALFCGASIASLAPDFASKTSMLTFVSSDPYKRPNKWARVPVLVRQCQS